MSVRLNERLFKEAVFLRQVIQYINNLNRWQISCKLLMAYGNVVKEEFCHATKQMPFASLFPHSVHCGRALSPKELFFEV